MQSLADLTGLDVERPKSVEMSILGVAFLAGLQCGMNHAILLLRIIYISHISNNLKSFYSFKNVCAVLFLFILLIIKQNTLIKD